MPMSSKKEGSSVNIGGGELHPHHGFYDHDAFRPAIDEVVWYQSSAILAFAVSAYSIMAGITGFISAFLWINTTEKGITICLHRLCDRNFLLCFRPELWILLAARTLAGFFGGMIAAQVLSIVADTFEYQRRASAMGILMTSFSLASVIGVPTGLWLAAHYSWHAPFFSHRWTRGGHHYPDWSTNTSY